MESPISRCQSADRAAIQLSPEDYPLGDGGAALEPAVLDDAALNEHRTINRPAVLSGTERELVLYGFNRTARVYPQGRQVHEIFEEQVAATPDAVAVICEAQSLTYRELDAKANQLAHYLASRGVQPGDYVPIVMPRCLQTLIAQLAVLKCSAVYVPVDMSLPPQRQEFMIRDCSARHVLALPDLSDILVTLQREGVERIDCEAGRPERCPRTIPSWSIRFPRPPTSCTPPARPDAEGRRRSRTPPSCGWSSTPATSR